MGLTGCGASAKKFFVIQRTATIRNTAGIHCRPSATIIKATHTYEGEVVVTTEIGEEVDLRSMLALVALGLEQDAKVTIRVSGPGEDAFCDVLVELFERHFDFPSLSPDEQSHAASDMLGDV